MGQDYEKSIIRTRTKVLLSSLSVCVCEACFLFIYSSALKQALTAFQCSLHLGGLLVELFIHVHFLFASLSAVCLPVCLCLSPSLPHGGVAVLQAAEVQPRKGGERRVLKARA